MCAGQAFDGDGVYPDSYSLETCLNTKAETIAQGLKCDACFTSCRLGRIDEADLVGVREQVSQRDVI